MAILLDASLFYAFKNNDDVHHKKAREIMRRIVTNVYGEPFTTNFIFDEVVSVTMRKKNKNEAKIIGKYLLDSEIHILNLDVKTFKKAWELFQGKHTLNFTDCTSVALAQLADVKYIATFDKEFKKVKGIEVIDS